jgi:hypothetical protein
MVEDFMTVLTARAGRGTMVAAIAAAALVTTAACAQATQVAQAGQSAGVSHGGAPMPSYYATLVAARAGTLQVVVRASATGAVTGKMAVPSGGDTSDAYLAASPDGRAFIVGAGTAGPGRNLGYHLYRFVLSRGGAPTPLAPLRRAVSLTGAGMRGASVRGIALSPDESKVAVSIERFGFSVDIVLASAQLDVVDVASGTVLRSWNSSATGYWAGQPSWVSNTDIAYPWWHVSSPVVPRVTQQLIAVDELNIDAPGTLLGGKPTAIPVTGGVRSAVLTPDGRLALLAACQESPGTSGRTTVTAKVTEVTAASGSLVRVLRSQSASYPAADAIAVLDQNCEVLSADPSGQHVLVNALQPGRIDNGAFTPLPAVPAGATLQDAAW